MHQHLHAFLESAVEAFDWRGPVYKFGYFPLEAASVSLHGCSPEVSYVGCDFSDPEELGRMEELSRLPLPNGVAGAVIALNLVERLSQPERTVREMVRILAPGGVLLIGSTLDPSRPADEYPFHPHALGRILEGLDVTLVGWQGLPRAVCALYAVGFKGPASGSVLEGAGRFIEIFRRRLEAIRRPPSLAGWLRAAARRLLGVADPPAADRDLLRFMIELPGIGCGDVAGAIGGETSGGKLGSRLDLME